MDVPVKEKGVYLVEAVSGDLRAYTLLLVSDAVMITKQGAGKVLSLVVDRNTGQPLPHVRVIALAKDKTLEETETGEDGIAEVHPSTSWPDDVRLLAHNGRDVAASSVEGGAFGGEAGRDWTGYIYTDRPIYRPGHTVHFKGILRVRTANGYEVPAGKRVNVEIQDPDQKPVFQQSLTLSPNGTIRGDLTLGPTAALGNYFVQATYGENRVTGDFDVQEYKKPEYEVHVTPTTPRVLEGEPIHAEIESRYYFGEPVAGAKVDYNIFRARYWSPLLYDAADEDAEPQENDDSDPDDAGDQVHQGTGQLDANGKLTVAIPTAVSDRKFDYRYRIEASVTDDAGRHIEGSGYAIATYASFLLKVSPDRYFYSPGSKASFTIQARDYTNAPIKTRAHVELMRWDYREPEHSQVKAAADVDLDQSGSGTVSMDIPAEGGSYRVVATARAPSGRQPEGSSAVWVSGGIWDVESENPTAQIIPDKKSYAAGDTARLLIATGEPDTPVWVAVEGQQVRQQKLLRSHESTVSFEIPVTANDEPGLEVSASFIRDGVFHSGEKFVRVPPVQHQMNVAVKTDKPQYLPGQSAVYSIDATSVDGKPVPNAEFSMGVVDEAIYGIKQDDTPPLLSFFFSRQYNAIFTTSSLDYYFNGQSGKRPIQLAQLRSASRLAQLKPDRLVLPKIRKMFPDTAFWDADLVTDASGHAQAKVDFPDSLTTWRATVRGVTPDTKVGGATLKTLVRKNLILRIATPRFFVQGDEVVISALVHNYLSDAKTAHVSLEVKGLDILDGGAKDVEVPSRGEAKVNWRVRAQQVRSVTITGKALTNEESDALELELPVDVPGVKLTGANGGTLTPGSNAAFDVTFPDKVQPASRGLTIQLAPSIAGSLFGALDFLTTFPYGCVEQTMSSFLPNIIVQNTIRDLGLNTNPDTNVDQAALQEKINDGLDRLYSFQHKDNGWGWWETDESHPFMTAYVVAGLAQARAGGVKVHEDAIFRGVNWLNKQLSGASDSDINPDLRAYMTYALALAGQANQANAGLLNRAYDSRASMSSYGLAVLGLALDQANDKRAADIAAIVESRAQQDGQQAWWTASRDPMLDFEADTTPEATAFATKLLARQHRGAALLPKAALWLMNHRNEGYWWSSTKQTAMVIYGLVDYLASTNELKPNLTATVYVNGRSVLTRKIDQIVGQNAEIKLNDGDLDPRTNHVRIEVTGEGRLYYSARSEYYSGEARLEKNGKISLNLLRDYFRLSPTRSGEEIVYDTVPLNGPVQNGDMIAVRLTVTGSDWKYLMIEDPIPAGTEFVSSDSLYKIRNRPPWWRYEFTRRELHDDRLAIFQTIFAQGQQQYFYLLRVVNPGIFKVSPAKVGPMYQPEISATTESRTLEVHQ